MIVLNLLLDEIKGMPMRFIVYKFKPPFSSITSLSMSSRIFFMIRNLVEIKISQPLEKSFLRKSPIIEWNLI